MEGNDGIELRIHPPLIPEDRAQATAFLASRGLRWDEDPDYTIVLHKEGRIVATGSLSGRIIKGLAVDENLAGEGLMLRVLSELEAEAARRGVVWPFIFTSPANRAIFEPLGYRLVGEAPGAAALLEKGNGIERWTSSLRLLAGSLGVAEAGRAGTVAALVMNCNPFTLGHLHLVKTAASNAALVFLFVVAEEASSFPYETRLRLVREGTAEFKNVIVVPGTEYIVSRATFPTYFLKDKADKAAEIHARLDVDIFGRHIAPSVGAMCRFIGEEPYSEVTAVYNRVMKESLPSYGIKVVEIPRLADRGGAAVSASTVRRLIREGMLDKVRDIVPQSTWEYLVSNEAAPVLARIAASDKRH